MSFLDHEIDMASSGKEISGLFVNSFELVGHFEDLDCSIDAGADRSKRVWCGDHHLESMAGKKMLGLLETMDWKRMELGTVCKILEFSF